MAVSVDFRPCKRSTVCHQLTDDPTIVTTSYAYDAIPVYHYCCRCQ